MSESRRARKETPGKDNKEGDEETVAGSVGAAALGGDDVEVGRLLEHEALSSFPQCAHSEDQSLSVNSFQEVDQIFERLFRRRSIASTSAGLR